MVMCGLSVRRMVGGQLAGAGIHPELFTRAAVEQRRPLNRSRRWSIAKPAYTNLRCYSPLRRTSCQLQRSYRQPPTLTQEPEPEVAHRSTHDIP
jgi:hypothetical protein